MPRYHPRKVVAFGKVQTVAEWAKERGLRPGTISSRLRSGWSPEAAVSTPAAILRKRDAGGET